MIEELGAAARDKNREAQPGSTALSQEAFKPENSELQASGSMAQNNTVFEKSVNKLSLANLSNSMTEKAQKEQADKAGNSIVHTMRSLAGDVVGVGTSLFAGQFTNEGLQALFNSSTYAVPGYIRFPAAAIAGMAVGGLVNNAIAGNKLLAPDGYLKNAVATASVYAAYEGLRWLPANQGLSNETMAKFADKGLVSAGTNWSGNSISQLASIDSNVSRISTSILNPLNYTPLRIADTAAGQSAWNILGRLQWAGFGGEATAGLFADGAMSLAEFNAREIAGKTLGTFAVGFGVGAANNGATILGELASGKKPDSLGKYLTDMSISGAEVGLATSTVIVPLLAKAALVN